MQGGKVKPGFDYVPVDGTKTPGQSNKDLGAKWGAKTLGPRKVTKGPVSPKLLGDLSVDLEPSESDLMRLSLDQPIEGDDQLEENRLDQAIEASDR